MILYSHLLGLDSFQRTFFYNIKTIEMPEISRNTPIPPHPPINIVRHPSIISMQSLWFHLLALIIIPYRGAQAHQPAELFDAFEAFLTGYIIHISERLYSKLFAKRIIDHTTDEHTSMFAPDCIGRINAMTG